MLCSELLLSNATCMHTVEDGLQYTRVYWSILENTVSLTRTSVEGDEIVRISLSISKNHKYFRICDVVDSRIKRNVWFVGVFWWRDDHGLVTNSELSRKNSTVEYVLVSVPIRCGISISSRVACISGKVNSFTVDSN